MKKYVNNLVIGGSVMIEAGTEQEGKMKKRILSFILCIAILCSNSGLTYAADFTPVSYTHLDVYKRQTFKYD